MSSGAVNSKKSTQAHTIPVKTTNQLSYRKILLYVNHTFDCCQKYPYFSHAIACIAVNRIAQFQSDRFLRFDYVHNNRGYLPLPCSFQLLHTHYTNL